MAVLLTTAMLVGASAARSFHRIPGVTYTIHSTSIGAQARNGGDTAWTARVEWAAGRGRMDIVDGGQQPMFAKGDYVLFDSATYLVVHPATKTFSTAPDMSGKNASPQVAMMRDAMKVTDVKLSLDTLEKGTAVNGFRTSHYRMHSMFTMSIDLAALGAPPDAAPPATTSDITTDLWFADDLEPLPGPFMVGHSAEMPGFLSGMKTLFDRMQAMQASMPKRLAVKQTTASKVNAMGNDVATQATTEIVDVMHRDVDESRLALPADYTQAAMAGLEVFGAPTPLAPDVLAKWRSVPKG